ncbi:hypothetical protein NQ318_002180 [Aromia moschata]|uniref:Fatty acyl-CoA reductase C-terminal domain-containing protein n=1 Tax=Aromia moschata TaxID=1265417 RepID=A0AAV8Z366_9CUCU|nr:hypothetical protein NQ318_002180 [Aromia moschata]
MILYQLLPAALLDGLSILLGKKPIGLVQDKSQEDTPPKPSPDFQLVKIQRKIYIAYSVLEYFMLNEWVFLSTEAVAMDDLLLPCDQEDFGYHKDSVYGDVYTNASNTVKGDIRYLLKEGQSARPINKAGRLCRNLAARGGRVIDISRQFDFSPVDRRFARSSDIIKCVRGVYVVGVVPTVWMYSATLDKKMLSVRAQSLVEKGLSVHPFYFVCTLFALLFLYTCTVIIVVQRRNNVDD